MSGAQDPKDIFREEARELLDELEAALIGLENDPADKAMIDTAFRALHTIKGSGTMFDFTELVAFAHDLENSFVTIRDESRTVDQQIIDLTLAARDHLRLLIDGTEISDEQRSAAGAVVAELQRSIGITSKPTGPEGSSDGDAQSASDDGGGASADGGATNFSG